jgi:hypothetical protein
MKKILLPIIGVIIFITGIGLLQNRFAGSFYNPLQQGETATPAPETKGVSVANNKILVEIAESDQQRRQGLSGRESLAEGTGMLFVFEEDSRPTFWMDDMNFAIDIVWIDNGRIVAVENNVQPEDGVTEENLTLYPAPQPIDYVLEVNAGYSEEHNLKIGDSVDFSTITN